MFVIGIDSHKNTLTGCVIDQTHSPVSTRCFPNTSKGRARLVAWAQNTDARRVGIEGSGHYGRPAALAIQNTGIEVVEVPPQMTSRERRRQRTPVKNDPTDALLIARVAAREENLPPPRPDGVTEDLRLLVDFRRELVEGSAPGRSTVSTPTSPTCGGDPSQPSHHPHQPHRPQPSDPRPGP